MIQWVVVCFFQFFDSLQLTLCRNSYLGCPYPVSSLGKVLVPRLYCHGLTQLCNLWEVLGWAVEMCRVDPVALSRGWPSFVISPFLIYHQNMITLEFGGRVEVRKLTMLTVTVLLISAHPASSTFPCFLVMFFSRSKACDNFCTLPFYSQFVDVMFLQVLSFLQKQLLYRWRVKIIAAVPSVLVVFYHHNDTMSCGLFCYSVSIVSVFVNLPSPCLCTLYTSNTCSSA